MIFTLSIGLGVALQSKDDIDPVVPKEVSLG